MSEESEESENSGGNNTKFQSDDFYTAIMEEDLGRIEELFKLYGSNFLIKIKDGVSGQILQKATTTIPLHLAACNQKVHSMQSLLSAGADPETRDHLGRTTLHLVISDWLSMQNNWPAPGFKLHSAVNAVQQKAEACLRLLCEHSVDLNAEVDGERRQTALHLSVQYRALPAVQLLASCGADVNAVDSAGMTPLHMASGILHKDIIAGLIKHGADVNVGMKHSGNTPLHMAALAVAMKTTETLEDDISCVSELLERGAEPDAMNEAGMTPLQEACTLGNESVVDLLLRYGADINKLNPAGTNCLFLFLNHWPNVRCGSLLAKLLSLTSPLTIYNQNGHLPSTLMLPCFFKQRDQMLKLMQQPRRLQDICKNEIYLKHGRSNRKELRKKIPERLYDFVFNNWKNPHSVSFVTDSEMHSFSNLSFDIAPS